MSVAVLLMVLCSFLITAAQYLFKTNAEQVSWRRPLELLIHPRVALGLAVSLLYLILASVAYRYGDLMVLAPILNLNLLWNLWLAHRYLEEKITAPKLLGTACILLGCWVITR